MTDSVSTPQRRRVTAGDWLFRPFDYIAGGGSLAIGVAAILAAAVLGARANTHFDGVLDVHPGVAAPLALFVIEGLVDWLALAVVLLIVGKLVSRSAFRVVDLFGTQAMARWPTVLIALLALTPAHQRGMVRVMQALTKANTAPWSLADRSIFGCALLLILGALIWVIALMYKSYVVCSNLRGPRATWSFVGGLIGAEALSKLVLLNLLAGALAVTPVAPADAAHAPGLAPGSGVAQKAQQLVTRLAAGDYVGATADFDRGMAALADAGALRGTWRDVVAENGPLQRQGSMRTGKESGYDAVYVPCLFVKGSRERIMDVTVMFDSDGRISGLWFGKRWGIGGPNSGPFEGWPREDLSPGQGRPVQGPR